MKFNTEMEAIAYLRANGCDEFEGMNCEDVEENNYECGGWDGESRRCCCGNRRVELLTSQDADGMWSAYGSAY